jgi:hypothetical protein
MIKVSIFSILFMALVFGVIQARAQTINTWVDEDGVTHYSDQKPADKNSRVKEIDLPDAPVSEFDSKEANERIQKQLQQFEQERKAREQAAEQAKQEREAQEASEREAAEAIEAIEAAKKKEQKRKKKDRGRSYDGQYPQPLPGPFPEQYPRTMEWSTPVNPGTPADQGSQ